MFSNGSTAMERGAAALVVATAVGGDGLAARHGCHRSSTAAATTMATAPIAELRFLERGAADVAGAADNCTRMDRKVSRTAAALAGRSDGSFANSESTSPTSCGGALAAPAATDGDG